MTSSKRAIPALLLAGLLILGMPATAAVVTNMDIPVDAISFNPCTNEDVQLTGTAHASVSLTVNGNRHHLNAHVNYHVDGIGLTSGDLYTSNATGKASENVQLDDAGIGEATVILHASLIAHGNIPNAAEFVHAHITVNANGTMTAEILEDRLTCH